MCSAERGLHLDFKRSLAEIHGPGRVTGVDLQLNELIRDPKTGSVRAHGTGSTEHLKCDMVLGSIGYCSVPLPGVPFDPRRGVIPNRWGWLPTWPSCTGMRMPHAHSLHLFVASCIMMHQPGR